MCIDICHDVTMSHVQTPGIRTVTNFHPVSDREEYTNQGF